MYILYILYIYYIYIYLYVGISDGNNYISTEALQNFSSVYISLL